MLSKNLLCFYIRTDPKEIQDKEVTQPVTTVAITLCITVDKDVYTAEHG